MLAEQHDESTEGRRSLGLELLTRARAAITPDSTPTIVEQEASNKIIPALSA